MQFTYYGHSCFLIETLGIKLLFDPFITPNELAAHINKDKIEADYILLSHGHGDHTADAEYIAKRTGAKIISNFEITTWYEGKGIPVHPMNLGGKWEFDFGTVRYVNAVHSSVLPDGTYGGNPGGFVISNSEMTIYFAGDTALTYDMKLIPLWNKVDVALLPIGDNFTMGIDDAVLASDFVECNNIVALHFDTFGYIKIDHQKAKSAFESKGKKIRLPKIGESFAL
jgi:L-ascorbate metabolism protein UlaG (beta-lactamase superfamily)